MMRICRDNSTHSFLSLPLLPPFHDLHSLPSHPTLCLQPSGPPLPPAHGVGVPLIPTTTTTTPTEKGFDPLAGDGNAGEGGNMGFVLADDMDVGLMSCTESLGFESSDEISSLHYGSSSDSSSSSSSSSSSFSWYCSSSSIKRRSEKREFPPPLTTMTENGRRNFVLRSERRDGRLEIVKVAIERPEVLYASRQNGRLTMHLVRSVPEFEDDDDDAFEEEKEETEEQEEEEERETEEEEEEEEEEAETEEEEERETTATEEEEEEREWKIPATGVRRCYQYHEQVWAQQQRRWVTTM